MSDEEYLPGGSDPSPDRKEKQEEELTLAQDMFQSLRSLVWVVLLIIFLFTFVIRITVVDGESMERTLFHGDIVLVRSLAYTPKQGDIVVLTKTSFRPQSIIKRVIAVEGQRVDVDYATSTVFVDGEPVEEPYIWEIMEMPWWGEGVNHLTVPEGCVYVMGDNRNNSSDSRLPDIGIVDERCIIGRALVVVFPFTDIKLL